VLFDAHPAWLDAVERVLQTIDVAVVGKVTTAEDALELIAAERPDVFVAEISVENDIDGITCLRRARELQPNLLTVVLSSQDDMETVEAALAAGASAYVLKSAHPDDVAAAIRQSFDPSVFLPGTTEQPQSPPANETDDSPGLTRRELEILRLVAEGHSNAELAKKLWITEQTVKFHLSNIYRKLEVSNRTEASRWAHLHGVVRGETSGPGDARTGVLG
jgi:NarL family two-component system response regulator LiaR